jgi:hypothetical protein
VPPTDVGLVGRCRIGLGFPLLQLRLVKPRAQLVIGFGPVLVL